jgi:hypothetical protein
MAFLIVVVLLVAVVFIVTGPLRHPPRVDTPETLDPVGEPSQDRIELEAQRDAKYREIRDAELDRQTGKLSDEDFHAIDSTLRAEAIEILRELDRLPSSGDDLHP